MVAAEMGEARGRREYNILGDTVNTAARLMSRAEPQQILLTNAVRTALENQVLHEVNAAFQVQPLGFMNVKGKSQALAVYSLRRDGLVGQC